MSGHDAGRLAGRQGRCDHKDGRVVKSESAVTCRFLTCCKNVLLTSRLSAFNVEVMEAADHFHEHHDVPMQTPPMFTGLCCPTCGPGMVIDSVGGSSTVHGHIMVCMANRPWMFHKEMLSPICYQVTAIRHPR